MDQPMEGATQTPRAGREASPLLVDARSWMILAEYGLYSWGDRARAPGESPNPDRESLIELTTAALPSLPSELHLAFARHLYQHRRHSRVFVLPDSASPREYKLRRLREEIVSRVARHLQESLDPTIAARLVAPARLRVHREHRIGRVRSY
jgi:hypothetical protein